MTSVRIGSRQLKVLAQALSASVSTVAKKLVEGVIYLALTRYIADTTIDPQQKEGLLKDFAQTLLDR